MAPPKDVFERAVDAALKEQEKAAKEAAKKPKPGEPMMAAVTPKPKPKPKPKPAAKAPAATAAKPAAPTALSAAGAKFIANFEGFRGQLYDDAAGHCTIGYGHLVHMGKTNGSEPDEFKRGITRERALELLQQDAAKAAAEVKRSVKVPLTQHQFDSLVCFAFNVGNGAFRESTLLKKLNAGEYDAVPAQLDRWTKAGGRSLEGLVRRRKSEGTLFTTGKYSI